ncbi:Bestrophin homolog 26 [Caenorhabditis elegans]|uniref:Bestrophin homolog 26 n=1 Tax=Caenorhabditis elegans TaxID=6239 RepID=BST26_CAEEL|nr:Bestrophin homolog 26 [Caenorhabditis elegans]O18304.1 RecName: Full=Bestrophin homolog 26 [Caenorhabditis elegans]CAB05028.1 Bestrophin homolog 26 [Caenorhabditis elegans]|eukprot:NP_493478.1 Bestrophin homolog 26 [Caenorhabditis elegans]
MTVPYYRDVPTGNALRNFFKIMLKRKGNLFTAIFKELCLFLGLYFLFMVIYRLVLPKSGGQREIRKIVENLLSHQEFTIPLEFLLGFFVSSVVDRWRKSLDSLAYIESCAHAVVIGFPPNSNGSDKNLLIRRTIIRYLVVSQILLYREISLKVRRRFKKLTILGKAKLLNQNEIDKLNKLECKHYDIYFLPISWALSLIEDKIDKENLANEFTILWGQIKEWQTKLSLLRNCDYIPIPLAYPQAVFLAVRCYFAVCVFTRQHLDRYDSKMHTWITFFPVLTTFQYIFMMGWMKVAEILLNPMGEDEDDFELNFIIDNNLKNGLDIVSGLCGNHRKLAEHEIENDCRPYYQTNEQDRKKNRAPPESLKNVEFKSFTMEKASKDSPMVVKSESVCCLRRRFNSSAKKHHDSKV